MIVTFEGMDGSGKTSVAKAVAKELNYKYIHKATALLFDENEDGENIPKYLLSREIISVMSAEIRAYYFALEALIPHLHLKNRYCNIVVDRGVASNYFWSHKTFGDNCDEFYRLLIEFVGKPDITILLYADEETRIKRISNRNSTDNDLKDSIICRDLYDVYRDFFKRFSIPFFEINADNKGVQEIVAEAVSKIKSLSCFGGGK
jgi:thymidylate kinase